MTKIKKMSMRKPYVQKNIIISKGIIKQFVRPEWHREYRENHIKQIMAAIKKSEHPSENITVNESSSNLSKRIINGNHRIEAVRRLIDENRDFKIEMSLTVYYDLSKDEEVKIYEKVNNTKKETGF